MKRDLSARRDCREDGIKERERDLIFASLRGIRVSRAVLYSILCPKRPNDIYVTSRKPGTFLADYGWSRVPYQNHLSKLSTSEIY